MTISPGIFKIISTTDGKSATSIKFSDQSTQIVCLGFSIDEWQIEQVKDDDYRFAIGGYSYTGVKDGKVIVSTESSDNKLWRIVSTGTPDVYTIVQADDTTKGWAVSPDKSANPEILIDTITTPPGPNQLFKAEAVE